MAGKNGGGSWYRYCTIFFFLEILFLIAFSSPRYISKVIAYEGIKIEDSLGTNTLRELDKRTSQWFNTSLIESGAYAEIWHMLIPNEYERKKSSSLNNLGNGLFRWVDDRLTVCMFLIFQFFERLHLMLMWLPSSALVFAAAGYTGLELRRIKQGDFAYASPVRHRTAAKVITGAIAVLPLYFLMPFAISPYIYPIVNCTAAFLIMVIISNIAKRI